MTRNNTRTANLTLGGITLGFLLSYPFHSSFIGGLISSGCSAGMIGGFADWFAVTALFRRPLGIRTGKVMRTEIIPHNRERIFVALANMVQHELLSQDVLRRKLSVWDFSKVLIQIISEPEVQKNISLLLNKLSDDLTSQQCGTEEGKRRFDRLLEESLGSLNLAQTMAEVLEFSLEHGDVDQLINIICQTMSRYMDQPEVKDALITMIEAALIRYGEDNPTRKMVGKFLPSPSVLAQGFHYKVTTSLEDGTVEHWLKTFLQSFVLELKTKPSLQDRLNKLINDLIHGWGTSTHPPAGLSMIEQLLKELRANWLSYLEKFEQNKDLRIKVDEKVKQVLELQIGFHHNAIGRMVREGLDPLTDEKLVELIEGKAGNDLQMIRINGSVVGGLVGMLIYVLGMVFSS